MNKNILKSMAGLTLAALLVTGCDKITGGGRFVVSSGGIYLAGSDTPVTDLTGNKCTFTFTGQAVPSDSEEDLVPAKGQVQLVDQTAGIVFHGTINETGNSRYQELDPNSVTYWGADGRIKIGNNPFVAINGFQLSVNAPSGSDASAFIAVTLDGMTVLIEGVLEHGKVTIHAE
ncbi:MAG: hypothetical protein AB9869_15545 [Verrucomicrobiia bacterium]